MKHILQSNQIGLRFTLPVGRSFESLTCVDLPWYDYEYCCLHKPRHFGHVTVSWIGTAVCTFPLYHLCLDLGGTGGISGAVTELEHLDHHPIGGSHSSSFCECVKQGSIYTWSSVTCTFLDHSHFSVFHKEKQESLFHVMYVYMPYQERIMRRKGEGKGARSTHAVNWNFKFSHGSRVTKFRLNLRAGARAR